MPPPALVIEILSPSTTKADRHRKRPAYLAHGVVEVWLVDIESRTFERWTAQSEFPQLYRESIAWAPTDAAATLAIDFAELFTSAA
jgi:Uma2 family endonuclease